MVALNVTASRVPLSQALQMKKSRQGFHPPSLTLSMIPQPVSGKMGGPIKLPVATKAVSHGLGPCSSPFCHDIFKGISSFSAGSVSA